jgi:hypothetical protein
MTASARHRPAIAVACHAFLAQLRTLHSLQDRIGVLTSLRCARAAVEKCAFRRALTHSTGGDNDRDGNGKDETHCGPLGLPSGQHIANRWVPPTSDSDRGASAPAAFAILSGPTRRKPPVLTPSPPCGAGISSAGGHRSEPNRKDTALYPIRSHSPPVTPSGPRQCGAGGANAGGQLTRHAPSLRCRIMLSTGAPPRRQRWGFRPGAA